MKNLLIQIQQSVENFIKKDKKQYIQKLLIWTDKKINIHFKDEITSVIFSKYQIYWINFWVNIWTEFSWRRPALIIKNNSFIRWKDIIVLPITSQKEDKKYYKFDIIVWKSDKNWLSQNSVIKLEQIKTVSKLRIWDYIWTLEDEYKEIIEQKIHKLFL